MCITSKRVNIRILKNSLGGRANGSFHILLASLYFSFLYKKNSYVKIYTKLSSKEFKIITTTSGAHTIVLNTLLVLLRHYTIL